jgi:hypothetical protein
MFINVNREVAKAGKREESRLPVVAYPPNAYSLRPKRARRVSVSDSSENQEAPAVLCRIAYNAVNPPPGCTRV